MIKFKTLIVIGALIFTLTLLIPTILVIPFSEGKKIMFSETFISSGGEIAVNNTSKDETVVNNISLDSAVEVAVYRTGKETLEMHQLDQYLIGVVAAEMPAEFEIEALKAQALAARTYYVKQMMNEKKFQLPEGAHVLDNELYQVFLNREERKKKWGKNFQLNEERISNAVKSTDGQILTYNGEPIEATFFSTSNGYTENSEDYWTNSIPYLRSVKSPWDLKSPIYAYQKSMPISEFERRLGVQLEGDNIGNVLSRTVGKRVAKIKIGGKVMTGREVRDMLEIKSSDFILSLKGSNIIIETKGAGHGVGMSQYGADGMASEGKSYIDIVKYYYQGVEINSAKNMINKVMAKN